MMGMRPDELRERFDEIAEFTGLGGFLDMPFRTYSSGMQLRLAFATSTSIRPETPSRPIRREETRDSQMRFLSTREPDSTSLNG